MAKAFSFLQRRTAASNVNKPQPTEVNKSPTKSPIKAPKSSPKSAPKPKQKLDIAMALPKSAGLSLSNEKPPPPEEEKKPMTEDERSYANAMKYLSGEPVDTPEDEAYFEKLDSMLPMKASQSNQQRAKELAKAFKWMRKQEAAATPKESPEPKPTESSTARVEEERTSKKATKSKDKESKKNAVDSAPSEKSVVEKKSTDIAVKTTTAVKTGDPVSEEMKNCMIWLTSDSQEGVQDAAYFMKLDSMLPKKAGQSTEDRARDMVKALAWVKKTSAEKNAAQEEQPKGGTTTTTPGTKSPKGKPKAKVEIGSKSSPKSPKGRGKGKLTIKKEKGKPGVAPAGSPITEAGKDETPPPPSKAETMKEDGKKPNDDTPPLTTEEQEVLNYLQAKAAGKSHTSVKDGAIYKRLDNMMPSKKEQPLEERAKAMAKMHAWLKKKGKAP
jgi:hypothetical protein